MKKALIIVSIVVLTLALTGVFFGTHQQTYKKQPVSTGSLPTHYLANPMPGALIDPLIWVSRY